MEREPFPLAAARIRASAESSDAWRPGRSRHAHLRAAQSVARHEHVAWRLLHSCATKRVRASAS
eukprot:1100146-Pleurochrysis_carterae.AAC.1